MKFCTGCEMLLPLDSYHRNKAGKYGRASRCKECVSKYQKKHRAENKEKLRECNRQYRKENGEKIKAQRRLKYKENPEKYKKSASEWHKENRVASNKNASNYYQKNKDKLRARALQHYRANKDQIIKKKKEKYQSCGMTRLRVSMNRSLGTLLRRTGEHKAGTSDKILGYSREDLIARLEVNLQLGMSWDNYGEWHIDHTIPISHFLRKGETRPQIINALSNLRPLWAKDNLSKGASLPEPLRREDV